MHERNLKNHAVLLRFDYDGHTFTEVGRRSEAMKVVASDPTRGFEGRSGFWYEVQNAAGDTLYRRITQDSTFPYREVSSPHGKRTVEIVVPDIAEGEHARAAALPARRRSDLAQRRQRR